MSDKAVFKMDMSFGRMGSLEGLFVAEKEDVKNLMGKYVYFGEVLGKHSEVYCTFEQEDLDCITMISDDPKIVALFEEHNIRSGYNPLDYLEE